MPKNEYLKPIRWVLLGDYIKSFRLIPDGRKVLWELKNIGQGQHILRRPGPFFGSQIECNTAIEGLDIVTIKTVGIVEKKKKEVEMYNVIPAGYKGTTDNIGYTHKFPSSLGNYKETPPYNSIAVRTSTLKGVVGVDSNKSESWHIAGYDHLTIVNLTKMEEKERVDFNVYGEYRWNFSMVLDIKDGYAYVGVEDNDWDYAVYQIDMKTRLVTRQIKLSHSSIFPEIRALVDYTDSNGTRHHYLYVGGNFQPAGDPGFRIDKYNLPDLTLASYVYSPYPIGTIAEGRGQNANNRKGYFYVSSAVYPRRLLRFNVIDDTITATNELTDPYFGPYFNIVNDKTGDSFWPSLDSATTPSLNRIYKFDRDMNYLSRSEQFGMDSDLPIGIAITEDGSHVFTACYNLTPTSRSTIVKVRTNDLTITNTYENSGFGYRGIDLYYPPDQEVQ